MSFVRRNAEGQIEAVFHNADSGAIIAADERLQADLALTRVTEDLIEILIDKGVISFTDLPKALRAN
ncbi:MAG: hypothetical protein CMM74_01245 [Rhodospirillaceae bacterium]|jgi:hypothetical protein|nr:hypothetical protein [Rhodospirillaceae bacterium]MDP6926209.1 hypothetical protein [Rhodospirillales bacterium]